MDENTNLNEGPAEKAEEAKTENKKERRPGGETGEQFVKSIGVAGCVFFLALFVIFLVFCFTSGSRTPVADIPQFSFAEVICASMGGSVHG